VSTLSANPARPLRKIVATTVARSFVDSSGILHEFPRELLECGHLVLIREDTFGRTNANARRCRKCGKSKPPEVSVWPPEGNLKPEGRRP